MLRLLSTKSNSLKSPILRVASCIQTLATTHHPPQSHPLFPHALPTGHPLRSPNPIRLPGGSRAFCGADVERETLSYDIVIVGAGPAGLSAAIRVKQLCRERNIDLSVCVVEKGAEVGSHILSGNVFETRALDELLPNWRLLLKFQSLPTSFGCLQRAGLCHFHLLLTTKEIML